MPLAILGLGSNMGDPKQNLDNAVAELANLGSVPEIADYLRKNTCYADALNTLEEDADALYISSMRKLHTEDYDIRHVIAWSEIYNYLEKCADACEHVADTVGSVVMKNS